MARRIVARLGLYGIAIVAAIVLVGPLLWMLSASLKTSGEALAIPAPLLPAVPRWQNYVDVFSQVPFARYMLNSLFVATTVTVVALLFHSMAAYSLARLRYPGRKILFGGIVATLMIPASITLIPTFIIVRSLGWLDTYWALIVPALFNAFGIFLLRQFYLGLPRELEEA